MCKMSKVTLILLIAGVMSNSFSSQASSVIETSKKIGCAYQTNKTINAPASKDAEEIVIDDLVMIHFSSNTAFSLSSMQKKQAGESMNISVGNTAPWRAKFKVGSEITDIALSYDVQNDRLSFDKSVSNNVTYKVDPNGTFIDFFINGHPFFSLADMKTCDKNMCGTINFSMDNTIMSLYDYAPNGESAALVAKTNTKTQHTNAYQLIGEADNIKGESSKKALISTHLASPNPFTNNTTIKYNLTNDAQVRVTIYNSLGQQVSVLVNQFQTKGVNTIDWKMTETLRGGIYFYEILANNESMVGKLIKQ
jgi:Secretion system C-terminal sorting domain